MPERPTLDEPRISQEQAMEIADNDLRKHLDEYQGISHVIVNATSGYVPFDEFKSKSMKLPIVYVSSSGELILLSQDKEGRTIEAASLGQCEDALYAYCGFLPHFNFDYRNKVVYGVEVTANGIPFLYIVDAANGKIVDSTFLRDEKIRSLRSE